MKRCKYVTKNKFSINLAEMQVIIGNCSVHPKINVKFHNTRGRFSVFLWSLDILPHDPKADAGYPAGLPNGNAMFQKLPKPFIPLLHSQ